MKSLSRYLFFFLLALIVASAAMPVPMIRLLFSLVVWWSGSCSLWLCAPAGLLPGQGKRSVHSGRLQTLLVWSTLNVQTNREQAFTFHFGQDSANFENSAMVPSVFSWWVFSPLKCNAPSPPTSEKLKLPSVFIAQALLGTRFRSFLEMGFWWEWNESTRRMWWGGGSKKRAQTD